ncbi:MAG: PPC domain-containing protein, partial [Planctomycetota bacterium]
MGLQLRVTGAGSILADFQTFLLTGTTDTTTQATTTATFQFVNTTTGGSASGSNIGIPFDPTMDRAAIAVAIATAINQSNVGRATVDGDRIALTGTVAAVTGTGLTAVRVEQLSSLVISSQIEAKPYNLVLPGGLDEPGHRQIPEEAHVIFGADRHSGITTLSYNFQSGIGNDPAGRPLFNVITEAQKQRAREIFHMYGELLGVQFIESEFDGLTIATGDMRAIAPTVPTGPNDGLFFLRTTVQVPTTGNVNGLLILDNAENWDDGFGATDNPGIRYSWFEHAMQGIGSLLGMGNATELPAVTLLAGPTLGEPTLQFQNPFERVYPGSADVVHGQYLYRPEGQDIDMFRIDVPETGMFSAEVIAERQLNSSLLDAVLMLFRDVPGGTPELIARNDDYYSKDSFFELELKAGVYWVGVSASGNDQYDPVIEDSGFNGTSEGRYDLRLNFRPDTDLVLRDATGVAVDGDGNGTPGGVHNFWFEAQDESRTIYVDKVPPLNPTGNLGSIRNPHTLISTALADVRGRANAEDFIVRIVGNGGTDRNIATLGDNIPYEIGFNQTGTSLADGTSLEVPNGVTVMIDSGAVIKSRRGRIAVGSSSPTVDRSEAALQVLGTPLILDPSGLIVRDIEGKIVPGSVYFTSLHDDAIGAPRGVSGHLPVARGDWGGLVFQADIDRADANRVDVEDRGIFLNYVSNADMRYGGGNVIIDGIPQSVSPIHMIDARVTATFNDISLSADAAISASPDSFEETNFHAAEYQFSPFTSDYQRVGPDIYGNRLTGNSINGLFVRVLTPAGSVLRSMTVPGRFDDRDITHVLAENLVIQGTPGGPIQDGERPETQFVTLEATAVYAVVGVGSEVVDGATLTVTLANGTPIDFEFVDDSTGRIPLNARPILFNQALDRAALATVIANAISAAGIQALRNVHEITLLGGLSLVSTSPVIASRDGLDAGTYNYKIVFVDADGNEGLASLATSDITFADPQNSIRLLNLPLPTAGFVSRYVYRSDATGNRNGVYTLVAEINGSDTFFVDDGRQFAGTLRQDTTVSGARPVVNFVNPVATSATLLQVIGDGAAVVDGDTLTLTPVGSLPITFEFVDATSTRTTMGVREVRYDSASDQATLARVVANAIAAAGIPVVLDGNVLAIADIQNVATVSVVIVPNGNGLLFPGVYNYKVVFVDAVGNEGLASLATRDVTVNFNQDSVLLLNLPTPTGNFVSTRIYRSLGLGSYTRVGDVNGSETSFFDTGNTIGLTLQTNTSNLRARLDGRLAIDPGIVVKLNGATIETRFGSQLIAEGLFGQEVIFTSINDDTYGSGGTFDTGDNGAQPASPGDWGGLYLGHMSRGSLDHAQISFGGGITRIEGNFTGFNAVEVQQAEVRIAHSAFRDNADGTGGQAAPNRSGRGENDSSLIFVRGAQPVIVSNMMLNNAGPVISFDVNSLNASLNTDTGRTTYNRGDNSAATIDMLPGYLGNSGPLVRLNALGGNDINGLQVRGGTLTTQGVWDDTDIVHVLMDQTVYIPDFHTFGGLRLESSASQSLVVKLRGPNAGLTALGRPLDIDDRIGGSLQILGQPAHPVVITSLGDNTAGAGFTPAGNTQTNTGRIPRTNEPLQVYETNPGSGYTLQGNIGVSTDGLGTGNTGTLQAQIPAGATIELALLHVATVGGVRPASIGFGAQQVALTYLPNTVNNPQLAVLETARADVTSLVAAAIGTVGVGGGVFNFTVDETITGVPNSINGTSLTVIYSSPDLPRSSVIIQDGGLRGPTPYRSSVTYTDPIDPTAPGFIAQLALGIQAGADLPGQFSTVDINGARLTSSAGGANDSAVIPPVAGNQITVGGVGDSSTNPINPALTLDPTDDELYDLSPLLRSGSRGFDMDIANPPFNDSVFLAVLYLSGDAALSSALPGDWRSVQFEEFANDRNVAMVAERELVETAAPGNNATPSNAEFLGVLAPHDKAGDESLRLGFEVHGVISEPGDYDVYSFGAQAGTEVWFDIDRTSYALDTLIELIDANGNVHQGVVLADPTRSVFARSDNSAAEALIPAEEASLTVRSLQKSASNEPDRYTTNSKDAGMRVVLPGPLNTTNTYYLRVRSSGPNVANPGSGLTKGVYQLQIRLREQDEVAGSSVKYSDIRFATNGIEISGQPTHSPLLGEATETLDAAGIDTNDIFTAPEILGNILNTDRAALGVAGALDLPNDVDWFQFDVEYDSIQGQGALIPRHASLVFDLDYADGFARPNTNIWVFNDQGILVAVGRDSNISDDRPAPLHGVDVTDLSRGSLGALDPYIGPIELPANGTESGRYFVAVSSNAIIPIGMEQFLVPLPRDPLLRLEPSNSVPRIAEDHVTGTNLSNIAQGPQVPVLFDQASAQPFRLSDVGLFALDNTFGVSRLRLVDPFTGVVENTVGVLGANVDDIALHPRQGVADNHGVLYGFSSPTFNANDANSGNYLQIDPRSTNTTNLSVNVGDDGIETYNQNPMNATPTALRSGPGAAGVGIQFDAIAIGDDGTTPLSGYAIGNRLPGLDVIDTRNLLYEFNPNTGAAFSAPRANRSGNTGPNALTQGAWTNIVEHGVLDTTFDPSVMAGSPLLATRTVEPTSFDPLTGATLSDIRDGSSSTGSRPTTFTVTGGGTTRIFEFDAGPEIQVLQDPMLQNPNPTAPVTIRDGDVFTLDDIAYEFDTGTVFYVTATAAQIIEGETFTVTSIPATPQDFRQLTFEFSSDSAIAASSDLAVLIPVPGTNQLVVQAMVDAINLAPNFNGSAVAVADPNGGFRITLINEDPANPARENAAGSFIATQGAPGVVPGRVSIPAEESMDAFELGDAIELAIDGSNARGHVASSDGDRVNFRGAAVSNFGTLVTPPRQVFRDTGSRDGTVTLDPTTANPNRTAFPVDFLAADTADDIAIEMVQAINAIFGPGTAIQTGNVVQLAAGFTFVPGPTNLPLNVGGIAPGGDITGLAWVGGRLFAVTGDDPTTAGQEGGGLYEVRFPSSFFADVDYIETATSLAGINFSALAAGPTNLEGGRYANILFGIDAAGVLYAFDTDGIRQPIFADGRSSVATGLVGVDGLAFSNLDYNLWHVTNNRNADLGHGVQEAVDGSRAAEDPAANQSWYFGYESPQANGIANQRLTNPGNTLDYDFIAGAHGSLISNSFDLGGFSAADLPTLYYNYYLETDNRSATLSPTQFMTDSFRVYVSGDDGVWHLVSTNNSATGPGTRDDEYDDPTTLDNSLDPNLPSNLDADVQQNFDDANLNDQIEWRQARIPLGAFAGQRNLRLRFDFDTAGGRGSKIDNPLSVFDDLLRQNTVGDDIRAIDAALLRDGQTFTLQTIDSFGTISLDQFELDFGFTLVAPGGAVLQEGNSFTVNSTTYIFDDVATITDPTANLPGSVAVPFSRSDSSLMVANSISQTLITNPPAPVVVTDSLNEQSQPSNDTISTAFDTTLRGLTASFQATGQIGDSPDLPNVFDVDLLRVDLQVGDTVSIDLDADQNSPQFDAYLRIFDANGVELSFNSIGTASGEVDNGRDPFLLYTATVSGTHYIGVSDQSNTAYNPVSSPTNPPVPDAQPREYQLEVSVQDAGGLLHQQGNRVNLPGVQTVTAVGIPAGFVEGSAGVTGSGFPINLRSDLTASEVANEIALALASYCPVILAGQPVRFCANGAPGIFQTSDEVITIIGHTFSSQSRGPLLGQLLGVAATLYGDEFGAFEASTNLDGSRDAFSPGALRLQNNDHEGLYLDDFIIGLAERGELVTGASDQGGAIVPTSFVVNGAQPANEINVGPYQLEIRRA